MADLADNSIIDTCEYPANREQDRRLGRIWARWKIPHEHRIALARKIKTIGHMANLASSVLELETRIQVLLSANTHWPDSPSD